MREAKISDDWPPTQPHAPISILHWVAGISPRQIPKTGLPTAISAVWSSVPTPWRQAKAFTQLWVNELDESRTRCVRKR